MNPALRKVLTVIHIVPTLREMIETETSSGTELEAVVEDTRATVESSSASLEERVWAAAVGVVAVEMIREERRADGCEA